MLYFEIISKQRKGCLWASVRFLLWLCSLVFCTVSLLRTKLYLNGYKRRDLPPLYTISVGNIACGGTGKTPFVIWLANMFRGQKVAILTRGYRSQAARSATPHIVSAASSPKEVGDEACLLARKIPDALVIVGKDRVQSAKLAKEAHAEIIILDDGMQHLKIQRDFEIVVLDAENPFGYGYLLPRGLLREPPSSLKRADLIVLHHSDVPGVDCAQIEQAIRPYTQAPILKTKLIFKGVYDSEGNKVLLQGGKVGLFCAIGKPAAFSRLVSTAGFVCVEELFLRDHDAIDERRLRGFSERCAAQGAIALLCTEKDIVKVARGAKFEIPLFWVDVECSPEFSCPSPLHNFQK